MRKNMYWFLFQIVCGLFCLFSWTQPGQAARYLEKVPGAMFRIGTASEDPATRLPLHNGGIRFDERAVLAGAVTFGRLAAEYLR